jgi:hypothetical protein
MMQFVSQKELIDRNRALEKQFVEDGKRIEELQAEIDEVHATGGCSYIRLEAANKRIEELQAKLQRIAELPHYLCEFPDIKKIGGAYRKRDVDEIIWEIRNE